jgi:hypothetical protein
MQEITNHHNKWNVPDEYAFNLDVIETQVPNKYYLRKLVPNYNDITRYGLDLSYKYGLSKYEPIAVVGSGLSNPINHKEYFSVIRDNLFTNMDSFDLSQATVTWKGSNNGAVLILEIQFPNINQVFSYEDISWKKSLRTIIVRSLDGTFSNVALHGDIDWFCANTLIRGDFQSVKIKNSKNFSVENFANKIEDVTNNFYEQCELEKEYLKVYITDDSVNKLLKDIFPNKKTEDNQEEELKLKVKQQEIYDLYQQESSERGDTLYSLMSAFTRYSTHKPLRKTKQITNWNNNNAKLHKREIQIQRILQGDVWKDFVQQKMGVIQ